MNRASGDSARAGEARQGVPANTGRVDLHAHTNVSDGTDSPTALIAAAVRAELDVVAITDHDSTAGWDEAAEAARSAEVRLVRGAEISVVHHGLSVHLLAYLFDPADPDLLGQLSRVRSARLDRARSMVDLIGRDYPITWDGVQEWTTPGTTVGRPHIADALVASGSVSSRDEAFTSILASDGPYYVPHFAIPARAAIRGVRAAGGVPVIAHPGAEQRGRTLSDAAVADLTSAGLAGLEVDHRDNDAATRERLRRLAESLGLLVTGASDYHGTGKRNRLGENTTRPEALSEILRQAYGVALI